MTKKWQISIFVVIVAVLSSSYYFTNSVRQAKEARIEGVYNQLSNQLGVEFSGNVSTLNPTQLSSLCSIVETQINNEKKTLNYCSTDNDCVFGIPQGATKPTKKIYGCGIFYNHNADLTDLLTNDSIHSNSGCDRQAVLDCPPLTNMGLKCVSNKCEYQVKQQNVINPQQTEEWVWKNLGCGSSTPCQYQVCAIFADVSGPIIPRSALRECYSCSGKYSKQTSEGEISPKKGEDPRTTSNFDCKAI